MAIEMGADEFEGYVNDALDTIPDELFGLLDNCIIVIADDAPPEDPELLGLYEGISLTNRGPMSYEGVMPDRITIYRLAICQISRSEDEVRRQVLETVVHEVGHHFGLDDEYAQVDQDRLDHEVGVGVVLEVVRETA